MVYEGRVLTAPNLAIWHDEIDLVGELTARLSVPVALGNDANVGLSSSGWRAPRPGRGMCSACGWAPGSVAG